MVPDDDDTVLSLGSGLPNCRVFFVQEKLGRFWPLVILFLTLNPSSMTSH
jgi:hypothetical protein